MAFDQATNVINRTYKDQHRRKNFAATSLDAETEQRICALLTADSPAAVEAAAAAASCQTTAATLGDAVAPLAVRAAQSQPKAAAASEAEAAEVMHWAKQALCSSAAAGRVVDDANEPHEAHLCSTNSSEMSSLCGCGSSEVDGKVAATNIGKLLQLPQPLTPVAAFLAAPTPVPGEVGAGNTLLPAQAVLPVDLPYASPTADQAAGSGDVCAGMGSVCPAGSPAGMDQRPVVLRVGMSAGQPHVQEEARAPCAAADELLGQAAGDSDQAGPKPAGVIVVEAGAIPVDRDAAGYDDVMCPSGDGGIVDALLDVLMHGGSQHQLLADRQQGDPTRSTDASILPMQAKVLQGCSSCNATVPGSSSGSSSGGNDSSSGDMMACQVSAQLAKVGDLSSAGVLAQAVSKGAWAGGGPLLPMASRGAYQVCQPGQGIAQAQAAAAARGTVAASAGPGAAAGTAGAGCGGPPLRGHRAFAAAAAASAAKAAARQQRGLLLKLQTRADVCMFVDACKAGAANMEQLVRSAPAGSAALQYGLTMSARRVVMLHPAAAAPTAQYAVLVATALLDQTALLLAGDTSNGGGGSCGLPNSGEVMCAGQHLSTEAGLDVLVRLVHALQVLEGMAGIPGVASGSDVLQLWMHYLQDKVNQPGDVCVMQLVNCL